MSMAGTLIVKLYLAAILASDKLLSLGMLGEHVVVKATLAQEVFATMLAHKLLPLQVNHLVVDLQPMFVGKLLAAVFADNTGQKGIAE
jgi:hypothetical protein